MYDHLFDIDCYGKNAFQPFYNTSNIASILGHKSECYYLSVSIVWVKI